MVHPTATAAPAAERIIAHRRKVSNVMSYFKKYATLDDEAAELAARAIWRKTNLPNLREHILPAVPRASLGLTKGPNHVIEEVGLREL